MLVANCKAKAGRQLAAGVMVAASQSSTLVCCIRSCSNQSPALYGYHQAGGLSLTRRGTIMQRDVQRGGTAMPGERIEEQAYNFLDSSLLVFRIRLLSTSLPRQHSPERLPHPRPTHNRPFPTHLELRSGHASHTTKALGSLRGEFKRKPLPSAKPGRFARETSMRYLQAIVQEQLKSRTTREREARESSYIRL